MDILWIFIKTFRKNVLKPRKWELLEDEMDKYDPNAQKKGPPCGGPWGMWD